MIDALVTGRSITALLAALDLAEVGLRVLVATDARIGEPPAAPVRDPEGVVADFLRRVAAPIEGTGAEPSADVLPRVIEPVTPLLVDRDGLWAPQSEPSVLGIPAVPLSAESLRLLGRGGAVRAYLDRVTPLLTVGKTSELGTLVQKRLGTAARERLVEPEVRERFGVCASDVDVAVAAPGLNEALSRVGSLTAAALAYSDRNVARETRVEPAGGGAQLKAALLRKLDLYGAQFADAIVMRVETAEGGWRAELSDGQLVEARALVLDFGRSAERTEVLDALCPELLPHRVRVHAATDIELPEWLGAGRSAVRWSDGWSVRVEARAGEDARAFFASDALAQVPEVNGVAAILDPLLERDGVVPAPNAEWAIGVAAAPFATLAERDAAEAMLAGAAARDPELLPVGRVLWGDDLGPALASAHSSAVALRRRLTGLAE